jgi:excisionase family DNA binding protein
MSDQNHPERETPVLLCETPDVALAPCTHFANPHDGHDQGGSVEARERLLTPGEVASLFRVDPKTVTRWAAAGRISSIRTPGGHRRFRESEVRALLRGDGAAATAPAPRQSVEDEPARS